MTDGDTTPHFFRCATVFKGEQCRLSDDHEYEGRNHRFVDPVETTTSGTAASSDGNANGPDA